MVTVSVYSVVVLIELPRFVFLFSFCSGSGITKQHALPKPDVYYATPEVEYIA